jgi:hypothetical protein
MSRIHLSAVVAILALMAAIASACASIPAAYQGVAAAPAPGRPFGDRTRDSGCTVHDSLPDSACTPGAVFADVTVEQICRTGYSASVRNVPAATSREVYRAYGISERGPGEYEVDHLVPLEVGGSNDIANLWPEAAEPRPGFHEKDRVEDYLHDEICSGRTSLLDAQRAVATNWLDVYQQASQRGAATAAPAPAETPQSQTGGEVAITSISGAAPGDSASLAVQTQPGASCSISYRTPSGTASTAQGLEPKTADASGEVTWTWNIGQATRRGTGSVAVTCNGASATSPIEIQ